MTCSTKVEIADLDAAIERRLVGRPMPSGQRLLGIEYERLVLDRDTDQCAPLAFVQSLLRHLCALTGARPLAEGELLKGISLPEFELTTEPGGQLELATRPAPSLAGVDASFEAGRAALEGYLASTRYRWVGLGHAPVTPVEELGLLPRARYRIMDARMPARGPLSRNMMRGTAGFQLAYDVADREDAARKLAFLYRLCPVFVALTANSRRVRGVDSGYASFRHHVWLHTDHDRVGVPAGCLRPETALSGYVAFARRARVLFQERDGAVVEAPEVPFEELVARGEVTDADVDLHLSSLFPLVRLRDYLEVRCFDSVGWTLARSVMSFVSGLIYCDHAFASAFEVSEPFVIDDPARLVALHEDAAKRALDAVGPDGRTLRQVARELLGIATATIGGPSCDWSRPVDLEAVAARIGG
ncbi:MAG: hypothetical protein IPM29_29515 [Planctomycetes bacterium]|nr:hypothetical protein [Planctomycetota bacterium]